MADAADRYLQELDRELGAVPARHRREIVDDIAAHIEQARAEEGDGALPAILDRLGDPAVIAAEARERFDVPAARPGWAEIATVILLPIGGLVLPVLGWVIGVVLLWSSSIWSRRDKLIGTLVVPGGLLLPFFLGGAATYSESCTSTTDAGGHSTEVCTGGGPSGLVSALVIAALVVLLVAPIVSAAHLERKRRAAAVLRPHRAAA